MEKRVDDKNFVDVAIQNLDVDHESSRLDDLRNENIQLRCEMTDMNETIKELQKDIKRRDTAMNYYQQIIAKNGEYNTGNA